MRRRLLPLLFALAAPLGGCFSDAEGGGPTLTIRADRADIAEQVNLTVTLVVMEPYTFTTRGCGHVLVHVNATASLRVPLYGYEGVDDRFAEVACAGVVGKLRLAPGTYERTVSWNGRVDAAPPGPHRGERLPPGEYVVHAALHSVDDAPSAEVKLRLL